MQKGTRRNCVPQYSDIFAFLLYRKEHDRSVVYVVDNRRNNDSQSPVTAKIKAYFGIFYKELKVSTRFRYLENASLKPVGYKRKPARMAGGRVSRALTKSRTHWQDVELSCVRLV